LAGLFRAPWTALGTAPWTAREVFPKRADVLEHPRMHPTYRDQGLGNAARRGRFARSSAIGTHRALFQGEGERRCDLCDAIISTLSSDANDCGSGLYVWTRGTEVRYEEPPLCGTCGPAIALSAMRRWEEEDEEEG
jgi:hypothetical protein